MFTGLIETLGTIKSISKKGTSILIGIRPDIDQYEVRTGDSVAIDGFCLTVEYKQDSVLVFSAVRETLNRTTLNTCNVGRRVNLERALRLSDRLDGHFVLGHVDGLGSILSDEDVNGSILRKIIVAKNLQAFMAEKGSVAIDGVSLTIAESTDDSITVSIIPSTIERTNILEKKPGDKVNIECDVIARYLFRFTKFSLAENGSETEPNSLINKLERFGF
jgi:riboflavin synthase